ncbi:ABC-type tungstate transport system permease subunit [Frondihabitans sp. PhB188]|uniref:substrate-binding domain-containing protein n=1 Tax=Frondihabitans sp. PhB188 TaxID=2485200 RepID=UPI000F4A94D7|nr:substrate-binding domain-containing protein [Frondihabitans sp. PhB188]ROQ37145.1 ABC-type tungstate transport system permease subunit [Frondihabitans sp. PhB188]
MSLETRAIHRRYVAAAVAASAALLASALVGAQPAHADDSSTLTVVGTSDVYDSNLVQSVIKPGFEKAYPQYTLNYVSKGTGAAIAYAEAGTASAMIVHAASLENQFVDQGYSAEKYGRAIFWGDYVLLGPASDPAGVLTDDSHDIAGAFEKIAAAGADHKANFVSRGGTPGTTVQEHAIWGLTSGVQDCTVTDANGGGKAPSTGDGACATAADLPDWYHSTGLTQGPNVVAGDSCSFGDDDCYVFTDRGTYQYLVSTKAVSNLKILTRDNSDSAPGTSTALVNSFHAYAVNPDAVPAGSQINTAGAKAFLNWITSPTGQTAVGKFLAADDDPPFIPSAAPSITNAKLASTVVFGKPLTFSGTLANVTPGTPALAGKTVDLYAVPSPTPDATAKKVATGTTDENGKYKIAFTPKLNYVYSLKSAGGTQVENATLNPIFGDILADASQLLSRVILSTPPAKIVGLSTTASHDATVSVKLAAKTTTAANTMTLQGYFEGGSTSWSNLVATKVPSGVASSVLKYDLGSKDRTWHLRVVYTGPGLTGYFSDQKVVTTK